METGGGLHGAEFALAGGGIGEVGADLDEFCMAIGIADEEIDFQVATAFDIGDFRIAAIEFVEHYGFESVAGVGASTGSEGGDESRVGGIDFARVAVALALGLRGDRYS